MQNSCKQSLFKLVGKNYFDFLHESKILKNVLKKFKIVKKNIKFCKKYRNFTKKPVNLCISIKNGKYAPNMQNMLCADSIPHMKYALTTFKPGISVNRKCVFCAFHRTHFREKIICISRLSPIADCWFFDIFCWFGWFADLSAKLIFVSQQNLSAKFTLDIWSR